MAFKVYFTGIQPLTDSTPTLNFNESKIHRNSLLFLMKQDELQMTPVRGGDICSIMAYGLISKTRTTIHFTSFRKHFGFLKSVFKVTTHTNFY